MKKSLIVVLSMLFVLGLAVPVVIQAADETPAVAKGDTKITLGGMVRVRGMFETNKDFDKDIGDNTSFYETSVKLSVHAKLTPNTEAMIELRDHKSNGDDDQTWGGYAGYAGDTKGRYISGGNVAGYGSSWSNAGGLLAITQAWIQHKGSGLLGVPAGIKIGHMPMTLGYGLFYDHTKNGEDGMILFVDPTKELNLSLLYAKLMETSTTANDDANLYSLIFSYKPTKDTGISADLTYLDDQRYQVNSAGTGATASTVDAAVHLWNLGLRGNTNISGFGLKAGVEIQGGKSKGLADYNPITAGNQAGDVKFKGYALLAGVNYKIDPVKLGLEYAYGSGDSSSTDQNYKGFVTLLDNKQHFSWVYEYRVVAPIAQNGTGSLMGLNNTQYVKGTVGADLTKDISGRLDAYWLRANKVEGFTYNNKKDIGFEIDPYIEWKIDKNLTYFVEGGYLFAGDFYKNVTTGGKDPDNPYAVRHGLIVKF